MNPVLLLLLPAAAGLVWLIVFYRHLGLIGGCLLTLGVSIVFGGEFFSVGPVHAGRALLGLTMVAWLVLRRTGGTDPQPMQAVDFFLIGLVSLIAISTFIHDWKFQDYRPLRRFVFFFAMPLGMYFMARSVVLTERSLRYLFCSVALFGIYLSVTAIAEKTGHWEFVFPRYIGSPAYEEFFGRGRGPLLNPAANGFLICVGWFSLLMLWPKASRIGKMGIGFSSLIFVLGAYCTLTRCVWVGAFLGLGMIVIYSLPKRILGVLAICGLIVAVLAGPRIIEKASRFKRDKNVSAAQMSESASLRPMLAYVAWNVFQEKPLLGLGYGQYKHYDQFYMTHPGGDVRLDQVRPYHQHNIFLSMLTETGLIGMTLLILVYGGWYVYGRRLWMADAPLEYRQLGLLMMSILAAHFANAMFQELLIVTMVNMVLFFFGGLTSGRYAKFSQYAWRQCRAENYVGQSLPPGKIAAIE